MPGRRGGNAARIGLVFLACCAAAAGCVPARRATPPPTTDAGLSVPSLAPADRWIWRSGSAVPGLHSNGLTISEDGRNNLVATVHANDSRLAFNGRAYVIDGPGSSDIKIHVDPAVGICHYAGLAFGADCALAIDEDGTLVADRPGVVGRDNKNALWVSRQVTWNTARPFFPVRPPGVATPTPPAPTDLAANDPRDREKPWRWPGTKTGDLVLDAPGSSNVRLEIKPGEYLAYGGLAHSTAFTAEVLKDGTLLTDQVGQVSLDARGNQWVSRNTRIDGRIVNAFFPDASPTRGHTLAAGVDARAVEVGARRLAALGKHPIPAYCEGDGAGAAIESVEGGKLHATGGAVALIGSATLKGGGAWDPKDGDAIFVVGERPLRVGADILAKGEWSLFGGGTLTKMGFKVAGETGD